MDIMETRDDGGDRHGEGIQKENDVRTKETGEMEHCDITSDRNASYTIAEEDTYEGPGSMSRD
jgi:hypothetical protein